MNILTFIIGFIIGAGLYDLIKLGTSFLYIRLTKAKYEKRLKEEYTKLVNQVVSYYDAKAVDKTKFH